MIEKEYKSLEYYKVLENLTQFAASESGREMCMSLRPSVSFDKANEMLDETSSADVLLLKYGAPSFSSLQDVSHSCGRAANGAVLTIKELLNISRLLKIAESLKIFMETHLSESDCLYKYTYNLYVNKYLYERIAASFPGEDEVADNASPALRDIRRKQLQARNKVKQDLDGIIHSQTYQKYLQDSIVTVRNGRYVIPVKAEYRANINGLVHDTSSSGATLFIEPLSVVQANNELSILESKEREEIERILSELSVEVGNFSENIISDFNCARYMDFTFAKAKYASALKASRPILNTKGYINISKARHPLIDIKTCVPIDLELGLDYSALIITGPNTGGKTVSLKTTGLLCLMAKSGLFIPAAEESQIAYYDNIYADIGDEQSIEQSLSTFSSHMSNIIDIIEHVDANSLVLMDELGSGTDPEEGAALAVAIIEKLQAAGAKIVCTTHYAELKLYAVQSPNVENASCEFDVSTLKPTYRLIIGIPGKSNAFAIAKRLGLKQEIIDRANTCLDAESVKMEKVLADLEINRKTVEMNAKMAEELKIRAEKELEIAEDMRKKLKEESSKEIQRAKSKALEIVENAQREARRTLNELDNIRKENDKEAFRQKLEKGKTEAVKNLDDLESRLAVREKVKAKPINRPLKKGDSVRIVTLGREAVVIEPADSKGFVLLQAGSAKTKIKLSNLELIDNKKQETYVSAPVVPISRGSREAQNELDIRGMNTLDADILIDEFLDNCSLAGYNVVSIIHGKGTGVLRTYVHNKLKKMKLVKEFRLGVYGEGEDGVTIVTLK